MRWKPVVVVVLAGLLAACRAAGGPTASGEVSASPTSTVHELPHPGPDRSGLGESLVLVIGGQHDSRAAADAANGTFGDMQGFYVVPSTDFRLKAFYSRLTPVEQRHLTLDPGSWLLVTAFRTLTGAEAFVDMATGYGFGDLAAVRAVRVSGTDDIGLGQEMDPDGSGPLETPLPDQRSYQ